MAARRILGDVVSNGGAVARVSLDLNGYVFCCYVFFFQAEDGIRDLTVTGVQTCALPIFLLNVGFGSEQCTTSGYIHYGPSRQSVPCYLVSSQYNPTLEESWGHSATTQLEDRKSVV